MVFSALEHLPLVIAKQTATSLTPILIDIVVGITYPVLRGNSALINTTIYTVFKFTVYN